MKDLDFNFYFSVNLKSNKKIHNSKDNICRQQQVLEETHPEYLKMANIQRMNGTSYIQ